MSKKNISQKSLHLDPNLILLRLCLFKVLALSGTGTYNWDIGCHVNVRCISHHGIIIIIHHLISLELALERLNLGIQSYAVSLSKQEKEKGKLII